MGPDRAFKEIPVGTQRSAIWDETQIVVVSLPDPGAADADLSNFAAFRAPKDLTITKVTHVPHAAWVAAAAANDGAVALKRANTGTAIVSLAVTSALAAGSQNDMGTPDATTKKIQEGQFVTVDITTNGTANAPASNLVIEFQYDA